MKREEKYPDTKFFHYFNANNHNHKTSDCVIRAISTATDKTWEDTYKDMCTIGLKYGYMPSSDQVISKYLTSLGWTKMKEPRDYYNKKLLVCDWLRENEHSVYTKGNIIANVGSHHIVCIKNRVVYDIWNSSEETMHTYWVKG